MPDTIQSLKIRIDALETELNIMRRMHGAIMEKKDPKAWDRLHAVGKEITNVKLISFDKQQSERAAECIEVASPQDELKNY